MQLSPIDVKYHCTRPADSVFYVCNLYFAVWSAMDRVWCEDVVAISFRSYSEALTCVSDPAPYLKGWSKRFLKERYIDYVICKKTCEVL